jgi:PAS domain S-box-containing protein
MKKIDIDFESAFEAMPGYSVLLDINAPKYTILATTRDYLQPASKTKKNIIGKGLFDVFPKNPEHTSFEGHKNLDISFRKVISTGQADELPSQRYDITDENGVYSKYYWRAVNKPILDQNGTVKYIIHTAEDITDSVKRRQQEKKLKGFEQANNLFMQAPVGMAVLMGPELTVELANETILDLWGKDNSIIGMPVSMALPEVEGQGYLELMDEVRTTGKPFKAFDTPAVLIRNGKEEIIYFNFMFQPYYENGDREPSGILIFGNDVTDKVAVAKQIYENEARYRTLIEESTVGIALYFGRDLRIQYVNEIMLGYWGKTSSILGSSLSVGVPELQGQPFLNILDDVFTLGKTYTGIEEKFVLATNGNRKTSYYNYTYKPLRDSDGHIYGIHHMAIDVTEQVIAKKALKKSEKEFRQLADSLPGLVWATNAEGTQGFISKTWEEFTGIAPKDAETFKRMAHPDDYNKITQAWAASMQTGKEYMIEVRFRNKAGHYEWFYGKGSPIRNKKGEIKKWVGAFININEQKKTEEELKAALRKIEENEKRLENIVKERTLDLSQAKSKLEQKNLDLQNMNKELESFAYISSHDLQEPLRKIQTFASRIMGSDFERLSDNGKLYFERIQNAGLRMQTLIDDLLSYSRTNTEERKFEHVNLQKIIDDITEEIYEDIEVYHATIETQDLCKVTIIPFQFRQIMHNLIGNALKFSRPEKAPHILIACEVDYGNRFSDRLQADKKYCHISVSDNGIGFDSSYGDRIFEVFQRLHSRDKYNGTGIGLAIVKKIIENHNGIITAKGELGKGATFDIYIPEQPF